MHVLPTQRNLHSLRTRLMLFLSVLLALLVCAIGVAVFSYSWIAERGARYARQEESALHAAHHLSAYLLHAIHTVQLVALMESTVARATPELLTTSLEQNPILLELARFDPQGRLVINRSQAHSVVAGLTVTPQTSWFRTASNGTLYLSNLQRSLTGESYLLMATAAADGGVVVACLRLSLREHPASAARLSDAYVINRDGGIVVHPNPTLMERNVQLAVESPLMAALQEHQFFHGIQYRNLAGEWVIGVMQDVPETDWIIVAEVNALTPPSGMGWALLLFVLTASLVVLLALRASSHFLGATIFEPLDVLRAGAARVSVGDLTPHLQVRHPDEIGIVMAAFNDMVQKLGQREQQLATAIAESQRTAQELARSVAVNRAIVAAIPDLLLGIHRAGLIVSCKVPKDAPAWAGEWLVGQTLAQALPPAVAQLLMDAIRQVLADQSAYAIEFQLPADEGLEYEARLAITNEQEVLVIVRDITERRRREALLQRTLEHERQLGEMKSRFMSLMSHEFRTPLAIIMTFNDLIERSGPQLEAERRLLYFGSIRTQIRHLAQILDDMLTVSRADTVGLEYSPQLTPFVQFCQGLVTEFEPLLEGRRLHFQSNIAQCEAYIDAKLMRQAITNLLSNAVKYSLPDTTIDFTLTCDEQRIEITVRDVGIGVPEEDQAQLFTVMHRGRNVEYRPGIGLGLAIVKLAVEQHGGTVTLASQLGVGTTFTITLPRYQGKQPPA
jgi:signal transduction histidine kinase/HAMP domain-containing protein